MLAKGSRSDGVSRVCRSRHGYDVAISHPGMQSDRRTRLSHRDGRSRRRDAVRLAARAGWIGSGWCVRREPAAAYGIDGAGGVGGSGDEVGFACAGVLLHESGRVSGSFDLRSDRCGGLRWTSSGRLPASEWWGRTVLKSCRVALDLEAEVVAVVDLVAVEVFVLQRAEGAFADAVLAGLLRRVRMWISSGCVSTKAAKRRDLKQGPTLLCLSRAGCDAVEAAVEVAGGVALEAAGCFARGFAFGDPSFDIGDRGGVLALPAAEHDCVEGAVELAVSASVEPVADRLARGGRDRGDASDAGEGCFASDAPWV